MRSEKEPVKIVRMRFARTRLQHGIARLVLIVMCSLAANCSTGPVPRAPRGLDAIDHIIVIYAENRSFDNLYGLFPGANGLANLTPEQYTQIDRDGKPFDVLPPVWMELLQKPKVDPSYPVSPPNKPFQIDGPLVNRPLSTATRDLVHRYYQSIEQINGGKNNRFAAVSDAGGLVMGYYDGSKQKMWKWAQDNTLADNFFMGAFGGSYLNHQWLVCACTPQYPDAPPGLIAKVDNEGRLVRSPDSPAYAKDGPPKYVIDGPVTSEGYSVNTQQPFYQPSGIPPGEGASGIPPGEGASGIPPGEGNDSRKDRRFADPSKYPLPPQTQKTVGDTLSAKGISWAWYAGAWNLALADGMQPPTARRNVIYQATPGHDNFQPHHQPFNYFARFAPGTADREEHLKDGEDFLKAIDSGTLPQVAFYKPTGDLNEHPGYTDVLSGDEHLADILDHIRNSPLWARTAVIVAYDENGGFWDHVSPPKGDKWGPGTRIPAIIISPYAKHGYVDHTQYDTTSIIKFITKRYGLEALPGVRESAGDLTNAFDLP